MTETITVGENKMELKQVVKSKTIKFNARMSLAMLALPYFGVAITPELTGAIYGIGNILLRFITDKPLNEK